jgi:predicted esterase
MSQAPVLTLAAAAVLFVASAVAAQSQNFAPPQPKVPDAETRQTITQRTKALGEAVADLAAAGVRDPFLADVAVYHKAAEWLARHGEFYQEDTAKQAIAVLDRGLLRATFARRGETPWLFQPAISSVRGYRSRVDGSLQPYAVTYPADYGKARGADWRLDVVLHGRDNTLTEVKFLHQFANRPAAKDQTWVQLDIFGRGNNAYRWAGETDVLEALEHFLSTENVLGRGQLIDPSRIVLRGFSMGGAGTWHLGLHRPDRWCVIGPGAGFTVTKGYAGGLPDPLPVWQDKCLHIYDAADYAENAADVPVVAYSGSKDKQIAAARNIEERLKPLGIPMTHLVAEGLEHQFPPEWQKKAGEEYAKYAGPGKGRPDFPDSVAFTTWTLKYPSCAWVELLSLDEHYRKANVTAKRTPAGYEITTANVRAFRFTPRKRDSSPGVVTVDGKDVELGRFDRGEPAQVVLEKHGDAWRSVLPQLLLGDWQRHPRKVRGLTGPIDDAFTEAFLVVRPTGDAWHAGPAKYSADDLERFRAEWSKFFRGELPVKDDTAITAEDIASKHLILFGDPSSNVILGQAIGRLPLTWTKDKLEMAGKAADPSSHVPVLIYPNPLNPARYVVVNSGHTFHAADFLGTNALLFPRLGDFALLHPAPTEKDPLAAEIVTAGLFDDDWKIPTK